jgi:PucR C-terminal helix-turn-helix domain
MERVTKTVSEPWRQLPSELADAIEPELEPIAAEIMETIPVEVPEYARPFEGSFGRGVYRGVHGALGEFVALIRDPDRDRGDARAVYAGLGRGELSQGRTLDSLQAAYRVGARVAWRRVAAAVLDAGHDPALMSPLAEAIFAFIDEISADSVEGYAQAQSEREGERNRQRRALVSLLLREPPPEEADIRAAAMAAGWAVPKTAAALACADEDLGALTRRLPGEALADTRDGAGCVILPDPDGPGRRALLGTAAEGLELVAGPGGLLADLGASWGLALAGLHARRAGVIEASAPVDASAWLASILVAENGALIERIGEQRLGPFADLTAKARRRMEDTALAYVRERGNAAAMARSMRVHPQTARYRVARLRELLGEDLDDPDARFELELALRGRRAQSTATG